MELADGTPVFLHLHDTEGKCLANELAALQVGVAYFDTAFGGMGGCPSRSQLPAGPSKRCTLSLFIL